MVFSRKGLIATVVAALASLLLVAPAWGATCATHSSIDAYGGKGGTIETIAECGSRARTGFSVLPWRIAGLLLVAAGLAVRCVANVAGRSA